MNEGYIYMEHAVSTAQLLLLLDTNIIRNCFVLAIIIISAFLIYLIIGIGLMKTQFFVCWKCVPNSLIYTNSH